MARIWSRFLSPETVIRKSFRSVMAESPPPPPQHQLSVPRGVISRKSAQAARTMTRGASTMVHDFAKLQGS